MSRTNNKNPIDQNWQNNDYEIKEQDRFLPIANVGRVMKKALPEHAKLSKESKECIQECVSEFISFITSQAADRCLVEKRKTLNGEDILWAMYTLGFENYSETLKIYLAKYRQYEQEQLSLKPPRKKIRKRKTKSSLSQTQSKEQVDQDQDFQQIEQQYDDGEEEEEESENEEGDMSNIESNLILQNLPEYSDDYFDDEDEEEDRQQQREENSDNEPQQHHGDDSQPINLQPQLPSSAVPSLPTQQQQQQFSDINPTTESNQQESFFTTQYYPNQTQYVNAAPLPTNPQPRQYQNQNQPNNYQNDQRQNDKQRIIPDLLNITNSYSEDEFI
ncbi:hypothetical protein MEK_03401 [Candida albicans 12C]|nr:hypothetical protein MEK_03401 [Candida albicans 12C]KHC53127.1 hypothetical protein MGC_03391 [Candida albicans P37039]